MRKTGTIYGINGPVIYLKGDTGFKMSEMVYVGKEKLVGEVISLDKEKTTVQVYEETSGLRPGETVEASGEAVSVTLAPGILDNIFDGIERPLERISEQAGAFITRGVSVDSLDTQRQWETHITVSEGDVLHGGDVIAEVPETRAIVHKCMVPLDLGGTVVFAAEDGKYTIQDTIVTLELDDGTRKELTMAQRWPIRVARPVHDRIPASVAADHRSENSGYDVPNCKRGNSGNSRRIRNRKDDDAASDCKVVECGYYHLHWMRRAWKRDDAGSGRIPGIGGSKEWKSFDGSDGFDCQYIQYAGGCQGSIYLYRAYISGILQRHGI